VSLKMSYLKNWNSMSYWTMKNYCSMKMKNLKNSMTNWTMNLIENYLNCYYLNSGYWSYLKNWNSMSLNLNWMNCSMKMKNLKS
jgi:hypothetical protein